MPVIPATWEGVRDQEDFILRPVGQKVIETLISTYMVGVVEHAWDPSYNRGSPRTALGKNMRLKNS
jgi:hypothetical protein